MSRRDISELASCLGQEAEAVSRRYLSNGRPVGRSWVVGDARNTSGHSMFVRLKGPDFGKGAAGRWTEYVAARVMLRPRDFALSHRRSTAFTRHNISTPREVS
ncbi:hypothetical protein EN836_24855 [Mesorhizobium sp. M1C.F.Ca.ET.193.01.1.1]|nr:hypothetical protein EN853_24845 [Mesorhizobium sp. M1C.F.Ca.ET.210.01.1.1]TGQ67050.1 hypothetical protein EN855_024855 [Mesorhizobium sp. M1C.F.Ca.ET.212.01.1.1]TGR01546.1 hypothetical protein EN847_24845 [Mesorhizobium sp. M1C.F.Ca.ET.204.01.1.1]TGR22109.1 hypothetical protein EN839_24845 [Mesorhizobium sp. M1C.F.Ca.ET.196.01.1.1]TGR44817.1 hypothetical protein EN838_24845 [Mesorhizobium sp. M1C.F.Ca.ET.195.01.1.1]TGR62254.1 hypothetical protein EN835_024840 [Mesorhizobium sp. M1C.F.Ca.ET